MSIPHPNFGMHSYSSITSFTITSYDNIPHFRFCQNGEKWGIMGNCVARGLLRRFAFGSGIAHKQIAEGLAEGAEGDRVPGVFPKRAGEYDWHAVLLQGT